MDIAAALALMATITCSDYGVADPEFNTRPVVGELVKIEYMSPGDIVKWCGGGPNVRGCIKGYFNETRWRIVIPYHDPGLYVTKHELAHFKCGLDHTEE